MRLPKILHGFTLIELLIVVAIIAILAAIAVPNFLEAQTRAKISRTLADMRTVSTGLESYYVDWNKHPPDSIERDLLGFPPPEKFDDGTREMFNALTTPIAYLTSTDALKDTFREQSGFNPDVPGSLGYMIYVNVWLAADINDAIGEELLSPTTVGGTEVGQGFKSEDNKRYFWTLSSFGPDGEQSRIGDPPRFVKFTPVFSAYDPTNGTTSDGDIVWLSGGGGPFQN